MFWEGQEKANAGACAQKDNDDRFAKFKTAQKVLNKEMMAREFFFSSLQAIGFNVFMKMTSDWRNENSWVTNTRIYSYYLYLLECFVIPFDDSMSLSAAGDQCIVFGQQHLGHRYKVLNQYKISGQLLEIRILRHISVQQGMDRAKKKKYGGTDCRWVGRCARLPSTNLTE